MKGGPDTYGSSETAQSVGHVGRVHHESPVDWIPGAVGVCSAEQCQLGEEFKGQRWLIADASEPSTENRDCLECVGNPLGFETGMLRSYWDFSSERKRVRRSQLVGRQTVR